MPKQKEPEANITTNVAYRDNKWNFPERINATIDGERAGYMNIRIQGDSFGLKGLVPFNEWKTDGDYTVNGVSYEGRTGLGRNQFGNQYVSRITILDTYVENQHRRKGVGEALVNALIQEVKSANLVKENTEIDPNDFPPAWYYTQWVNKTLRGDVVNPEAIKFWKKMGFQVNGGLITKILD